MIIHDLLTPLAAAADAQARRQHFLGRHGTFLDVLRRHRAPWLAALPLPEAPEPLAQRARSQALHERLAELVREASAVGLAPAGVELVLFASTGAGDAVDPLPHPTAPQLVLSLDRLEEPLALDRAVVRGLALLARWHQRRLPTPVPWDRVAALATVPLAEGVYAEGLAHHLLAAVHPELRPHQRFGCSASALQRLRERESRLLAALDADLSSPGLATWSRWFSPDAVVGSAGAGISPDAVGYLGWRLLSDRVGAVGLEAAAGMAA